MNNKCFNINENTNPLVSIIIPVYNSEKYIKNTLISLTKQTYKNIEILCVNDGSTDSSLKILEKFATIDKRIKIINQENSGPSKARNIAIDSAKGKYLSFVDSDDKVEYNMYEVLVEQAEKNEADIVVFGGVPFPNSVDVPKWIKSKLSPKPIIYKGENAGVDALFNEESSKPFMWLHFIKHDLLETLPKIRMDEQLDLGEDQAFEFMYFPRAKKVVFIEDKLYKYRWSHTGSLMWKYNSMKMTKFNKHLILVDKIFDNWQKSGYLDPYDNLVSWMIEFLYWDLKSFPTFQQYEYSQYIIKLIDKYKHDIYMCDENTFEFAMEIKKLAEHNNENNIELANKEIKKYENELKEVEEEIQKTINSGTFKVGRLFTRKKDRIDIKSVLPDEDKKN